MLVPASLSTPPSSLLPSSELKVIPTSLTPDQIPPSVQERFSDLNIEMTCRSDQTVSLILPSEIRARIVNPEKTSGSCSRVTYDLFFWQASGPDVLADTLQISGTEITLSNLADISDDSTDVNGESGLAAQKKSLTLDFCRSLINESKASGVSISSEEESKILEAFENKKNDEGFFGRLFHILEPVKLLSFLRKLQENGLLIHVKEIHVLLFQHRFCVASESSIACLKLFPNLTSLCFACEPFSSYLSNSFIIVKRVPQDWDGSYDKNFLDISGLAELTQLQQLSLSGQNINDIRALSALSKLKELSIQSNRISDISGLCGLANLEKLSIQMNDMVSDVSKLGELKRLRFLDLSTTCVSDFSFLAALQYLEELSLKNSTSWNIDALTTLKNLKKLRLINHHVESIDVDFSQLERLESLRIEGENIPDLNGREDLRALQEFLFRSRKDYRKSLR